ncbi:MAG: membrane protein insertase YidC [Actinomycetota bacterium]|nr:membrane protein insertase YidC [Actinomycetota bacterium]
MFQLLAGILAFFYGIVPNYAIAIALLTLTVMLVLSPLTLKSTRSMLAMQRLQPEIKKIQQKYKGGDRQQMQQEMMALYKEHQVNPMSGCLPMVVQLPVLFVMYHVIRGLTQVRSAGECPGFDPKYLDKGTQLFQDLCASGREMNAFGMDLAKSASQALKVSVWGAIPFLLLTGLVAFVQYYQSRQMTRRNPQGSQSPQIQMMTRVMPVMFGVFSFAFPAALNVYWFVSGLFRVAQQGAMYRWDPSLAAHVRDRAQEVEATAKDVPAKRPSLRELAAKAMEAKSEPSAKSPTGGSRAKGPKNDPRNRAKGKGGDAKAKGPKGEAKGRKAGSNGQARLNGQKGPAKSKTNGAGSTAKSRSGKNQMNGPTQAPSRAKNARKASRKRRAKRGR